MATFADPIEDAIARTRRAVPAPKPIERRVNGNMRMSSGRMVSINVPADLTDAEIVDLVGQITTSMRIQIRQAEAATLQGRIVLPGR